MTAEMIFVDIFFNNIFSAGNTAVILPGTELSTVAGCYGL